VTTRFQTPGWLVIAAASLCLTLALLAGGVFRQPDQLLSEKFSEWSLHETPSDIVVIGIDGASLAELHQWPWPRRTHAQLLDSVRNAGAHQVFIDIDFSSPSTLEDDHALEQALSRWDRSRIVLPYFMQTASAAEADLLLTKPLPALAQYVTPGSVNLVPDADSRIRRVRDAWQIEGREIPAAFAVLADVSPKQRSMLIDYSISPASFSYFSYADVLRNRVDPADFRGKTVLIGAVAVELGDMLAVPVHRFLPGVVIHALATQTARAGPAVPVPFYLVLASLAVWATFLAWAMERLTWQYNLGVMSAAVFAVVSAGLGVFQLRMAVTTVPFLLVVGVTFVVSTILSLNVANIRSRIYGQLAKSRRTLLDSVLETSYDGILCVDQTGLVVSCNSAARALVAGTSEQILAAPVRRFLKELPDTGADGLLPLNGRILEQMITTLDGTLIPVEISTTQAVADGEKLFTIILRDLRERRRQEEQLRFQATHDMLTGLPNRAFIAQELERRIDGPETDAFWLFVLDLTRFKEVNDTLGHDVGDLVLRAAASRFGAIMAERGVLARMGGDEFVVVTASSDGRAQAESLLHDLCESLREPIVFEGVSLDIGVSIGAAEHPRDGADAMTLLKNADIAMYSAKRSAEEFAFYAVELNQHSRRRLALLGELRTAIEQDQLELHYQPQISFRTGRTEGVEALLRWNHPKLGFISPGEIIPMVESTDLLRPLTDWTIGQALRQQQLWAADGSFVRMAVNLSARLLHDLAFPGRLAELLLKHDVPPESLELEITESAMMIDVERALTVGRQIREQGVHLSIDDYGTGYSSLSYLRDLSVGTLKLDRTFVDGLEESPGNRAIVESTLALAHALNLVVIAEGVSTAWQADYLGRLGYDLGQGYFYSKPLDAESCKAWLQGDQGQRVHVPQSVIAARCISAA
jgi:diguanylate cyclase (GGDEF)-like protein/PAS domain S-box-containing protein